MSADGSNQERLPSSKAAGSEEVLLFHDAIVERSLEQWEQGLERDGAHEGPHPQAIVEAKDAKTRDIGSGPGEAGPLDRTGTKMKAHWSVRSLRGWVRICSVGPYRAAIVLTILAASLTGGALVGYLSHPLPRGFTEAPGSFYWDRSPGLRVDGLIIPIDDGEKGLMVSALVIFSSGHAPSRGLHRGRWLHECLYDAAQAARSEELRGPGGMDLLRIKVVEAITKRHPHLKVDGIAFSEYLVL